MVYKDPIVAEVRKVRKAIEAEFGNDVDKYFEHMMEYQKSLPQTMRVSQSLRKRKESSTTKV